MAGHIQDRWYKVEVGSDGKSRKVKTERYGSGLRYRARYVGPDGTEKSKSFPDRQRHLAEAWLVQTQADMERGQYIDPKASRITFRQYAERWLKNHGADPNTGFSMESQLRLHAFPYLGSRPLGSFQPVHIRDWVGELAAAGVTGSYARVIYSNVGSVLSAAVDDGHLPKNPCAARSVKAPTVEIKRVVPWTAERIFAVRAALPERYQATVDLGAGCGLRQGEILGIAVDAIDFEADTVHVVQQLKLSRSKAVFAPPKGGKLRDVPLPGPVADALRAHIERFPPVDVTLAVEGGERAAGDQEAGLHRAHGRACLAQLVQPGCLEASARRGRCHPGAGQGRGARRGPRARHARVAALLRLRAPGLGRERQGAGRVPGPLGTGTDAEGVRAPHANKSGANEEGGGHRLCSAKQQVSAVKVCSCGERCNFDDPKSCDQRRNIHQPKSCDQRRNIHQPKSCDQQQTGSSPATVRRSRASAQQPVPAHGYALDSSPIPRPSAAISAQACACPRLCTNSGARRGVQPPLSRRPWTLPADLALGRLEAILSWPRTRKRGSRLQAGRRLPSPLATSHPRAYTDMENPLEKPMLSRLVVSLDISLREGPLIVAGVGGGALALSTGVLAIIAVPTAMAVAVKVRIRVWRLYRPRF